MSAFVDTSVLVRYLTADPPEMLDVARRIVDETDPLVLTDVVLTESAFVLLSFFYRVPRRAIVDGLVDLLHKENVAVHGLDKDLAIRALLFCRDSGRVSFADAMVWAAACSAAGATRSPATVYAFDQRFPSEGLDVRGG